MNRIQSKDYNIGFNRINKIYLSSHDDKDENSRISYFHKSTR